MAVEYDRWTDEKALDATTAAELQEIVGDNLTVQYAPDVGSLRIKANDNNYMEISHETGRTNARINNTRYSWATNCTTSTIKYFAKRSGELLIALPSGTGPTCGQIAIGPCSDGSWGIIATSKPDTDAPYDNIYPVSKNPPPYNPIHCITNLNMPNKMYLSLRKLVLREDVTFDNMYVNTYGYTDPFSVIEMNGERYASAKGETGNHVCFLMKL